MGWTPERRRVGLVGCVKTKRSAATAARNLYDSQLFHGRRRAVEASCDRWFILSAKHGLLDPDTTIEPYEETLQGTARRRKREWSRRVLNKLHETLGELEGLHVEIHAGQDYVAHGLADGLRDAGATIELPTEGLSLGQQLSYYRSGRRPAGRQPPRAAGGPTPRHHTAAPTDVAPPRGKYRPLFEYLQALGNDRWDARFMSVEDVLGTGLPASARTHPAWWANETATHSHARAWIAAGFVTSNVNMPGERVTFVRSRS